MLKVKLLNAFSQSHDARALYIRLFFKPLGSIPISENLIPILELDRPLTSQSGVDSIECLVWRESFGGGFADFLICRMRKGIGGAAGDGVLPVVLLFVLFAGAGAQSGSPPYDNRFNNYAQFSPSMAIIIVVLIAALFFMGFFSIYLRHCSGSSGAGGLSVRRALSIRNRRAAARGLDATVIETFPTFTYSEVKDHKIGIDALECAVCLNEFGEEDTLRLIPKCDHVFHPECIDAWLASHVTCPVCRANLAPSTGDETVPTAEPANDANVPVGGENVERIDSSRNEEIVIQVEEDRRPADQEGGAAQQSSVEYPNRQPQRSWSMKIFGFGKFRSHSTGHSMLQRGDNLERFTLKLPEEVRKEVITRAALNRTASSVTSSKPRGGEGSSRGGRSYQRMEKLDTGTKSDRWILFNRGPSMKSPKVVAAESSDSAGRRVPVRMPSFNCLEPRAESDDIESRPLSSGRPPLPPPA